jgi:hypothetical protein
VFSGGGAARREAILLIGSLRPLVEIGDELFDFMLFKFLKRHGLPDHLGNIGAITFFKSSKSMGLT